MHQRPADPGIGAQVPLAARPTTGRPSRSDRTRPLNKPRKPRVKTVYERADIVPLLAEIFRELGYEGTSLSRITERTGIGKGSLYHFFPGGKEEMAGAVLADVDAWFEHAIYQPLRKDDADQAIAAM
ncbi:TetR/AcrR family transcriptional regulator, partial [Rhizobium ruizarguesonis]